MAFYVNSPPRFSRGKHIVSNIDKKAQNAICFSYIFQKVQGYYKKWMKKF